MTESTYILTEDGTLLVHQILQCNSCGAHGPVYINMACVENDRVLEIHCPVCGEEALEVITYELEEKE